MIDQSNPTVVHLPFFVAVLTRLKRLFPRHEDMGSGRDRSLHNTGNPSPGDLDRSADNDAVLVITSDAAFVVSPDEGSAVEHFVLRIDDAEVRAEIRAMIDHIETLTLLAPGMESDADIQDARRAVARWCPWDEKRETALSHVAMTAIQIAERRLGIGF